MDKRQQMSGRYNNRRYRQERYQQSNRCNNRPSNVRPDYDWKKADSIDKCLDKWPLGMALIPRQKWENVGNAPSGLAQGSVFKDLVMPYCPVLQRRCDR